MQSKCPNCGFMNDYFPLMVLRPVKVREQDIDVDHRVEICNNCNFEYMDQISPLDPMPQARAIYRLKNNLIQPKDILFFRDRFDLSRQDLARLCGLSLVTIDVAEDGFLVDPDTLNLIRNKTSDYLLNRKKLAFLFPPGTSMHWVLDECRCVVSASQEDWQDFFHKIEKRTVEKTKVGDNLVSTVFIGLHELLFETMIFGIDESVFPTGPFRTSTYAEAEKMHQDILKSFQEFLKRNSNFLVTNHMDEKHRS